MNELFTSLNGQFKELEHHFAGAATDAERELIIAESGRLIETTCQLIDGHLTAIVHNRARRALLRRAV